MTSQHAYDNSQVQAYKNCPEMFHLQYAYEFDIEKGIYVGLRRAADGEGEHHAGFGSGIHAGLKVHYLGGQFSDVEKAFIKEYPNQLDLKDKAKTPENGIILLKKYINRYREDDQLWRIKEVETTAEFELAPGVRFLVKLDMVVEQQGCHYFVDHKSVKMDSNISLWFWKKFELATAITAYTAYVEQKYGECSGGIINALGCGFNSKAELFDPASDDPSAWEKFANQELKFSKHYGKDMMYASGFKCMFERQIFNRNTDQVAAWREQTVRWIQKIETDRALAVTNGGVQWLRNEGNCAFCSYTDICKVMGDQQIVDGMYKRVNPLEYLEE